MSGSDEQVECPLCMEPLEIDDINFFPCTCGYQICRFCWHRIRTDENGLCPACRKSYPEDPAQFRPLTEDELQRIKKERRQKDVQRKQKAAENRKHLANVRVVQRNLVFVVGLSQRLAETDVLRKHEYFGKFGKIHKVVINQSTSYAGAQGPSASAYVTYNKSDDALKAILAVNNVHIDGRTLKASLGTTKYCSHFLRGTQCPKTDCMYLHELGEEAASFTKEEMQVGKHQEYEQKLLEQYMNSQNTANTHHVNNNNKHSSRRKNSSPTNIQPVSNSPPRPQISPPVSQSQSSVPRPTTEPPPHVIQANPQPPPPLQIPPHTANKDAWPSLQQTSTKPDRMPNGSQSHTPPDRTEKVDHNRAPGTSKHRVKSDSDTQPRPTTEPVQTHEHTSPPVSLPSPRQQQAQALMSTISSKRKSLGLDTQDSLSLFSSINGYHGSRNPKPLIQAVEEPEMPTTQISETIPVSSSTDWQAAFGFGQSNNKPEGKDWQDDDLGFDPLEESSRGLADLIEKENGHRQSLSNSYDSRKSRSLPQQRPAPANIPQNLPPGFTINHINEQASQSPATQSPLEPHPRLPLPLNHTDALTSRMMGYVNSPLQNTYDDMFSDISLLSGSKDHIQPNAQNDTFTSKVFQESFRALFPNVNMTFGVDSQTALNPDTLTNVQHTMDNSQSQPQKTWVGTPSSSQSATVSASWPPHDPAILTTSNLSSDGANLVDSAPHWLNSINQLTDIDTQNHRLPFAQQFQLNTVWPPQTHNPPPGFQTHIRPPLQTADPHSLTEGLQ